MAEGNDKKSTASPEDIAAATLEFETYIERQKESVRIEKERLKLQGQFVDSFSKQYELQEKTISKIAEQTKKFEDLYLAMPKKQFEDFSETLIDNARTAGLSGDALKELEGVLKGLDTEAGVSAERIEKLRTNLHKISQKSKETGESVKGLERGITSLAGGLNLGITASSGFASNLLSIAGHMNTVAKETSGFNLLQFAGAMAGEAFIGVINRIGSEIATLAQETAKASAALAKLSGSTESTVDRFMNMTQGLYRLGVSADSFAQTAGALMNQTALLGNEISETDQGAVRLAAQLVTLGVDAGQLADTINLLSRGFGLSLAESTKFYESLITSSKVAGQSVADLSKNFQEAQGRLSATSSGAGEMRRQFAELNKMTKELGVSMSTLTGLAAGFDKFGDAADKVGKLNAQFNLGLSMTRMMNATDAQRIQMLRQAFTARGLNVAQMGKYEKLHIQSILNAKDEAEMLRMLGQSRNTESANVQNLNQLLEAQQKGCS